MLSVVQALVGYFASFPESCKSNPYLPVCACAGVFADGHVAMVCLNKVICADAQPSPESSDLSHILERHIRYESRGFSVLQTPNVLKVQLNLLLVPSRGHNQ